MQLRPIAGQRAGKRAPRTPRPIFGGVGYADAEAQNCRYRSLDRLRPLRCFPMELSNFQEEALPEVIILSLWSCSMLGDAPPSHLADLTQTQ